MKVVIVNGLLKKESEMKKILELVGRELDKNEIYFEKIDLSEANLPFYEGETSLEIDQIFNNIFSADAVIFATSVHTNGVSSYLKNFLDYLEISKYKSLLKHKMAFPVILHFGKEYINAYNTILNIMSELEMLEVNKINLSIPDIMNDAYVEASMKYIRIRISELCNVLVPNRNTNNISNEKLNQMLDKEESIVDENQLKLEIDTTETDIKDLANMVNEKLLVKEIVNTDKDKKIEKHEDKEKNITTIASKYKSKIEEIMQETLGDEELFDEVVNSTNKVVEEQTEIVEEVLKQVKEEVIESEKVEEIVKIEEIVNESAIEVAEEDNTPNITFEKVTMQAMDIDFKKVKVDPNLTAEERAREYIRNSVMAREGKLPTQYASSTSLRNSRIEDKKSTDVKEVNETKEIIEVKQSSVEVSKYQFGQFADAQEVIPYEEKIEADSEVVPEETKEEDKLKETTKNLVYLFKAPENEKLNVMMQVNVTGEEPMNVYINIEDNKCSIFDGINVNSDVTVDVSSDKWKKILSGETTLQKAFMTGMIKVIGNFVMLSKLDKSLFAYNNK